MESRMDRFREFASKHPLLKEEVRNGKRTWQNIYEEWVLYGENDPQWQQYISNPNPQNQSNDPTMDSIRNIISYVQKINPDTITKTLNTVQKVVQIVQTIGGPSVRRQMLPPNQMMPSMYNDWWD